MCTPGGAGVNALIKKRVQREAAAVYKALAAGDLPRAAIAKMPPAQRAEAFREALAPHYADK